MGFASGIIHVFTGPDHLAAIAPISLKSKKENWLIGFKWGLGHTGGVIIAALFVFLFKELIPINLFSSYSDRLVGLILIAIGLLCLKKVFSKNIHTHEHNHDVVTHNHIHVHRLLEKYDRFKGHNHSHAALGVGIIHGFAGSSHLLGILPALALLTRLESATYLGAFGLGTIIAMIIFSTVIGMLSVKFSSIGMYAYKRLYTVFGMAAIVIGVFWLFI